MSPELINSASALCFTPSISQSPNLFSLPTASTSYLPVEPFVICEEGTIFNDCYSPVDQVCGRSLNGYIPGPSWKIPLGHMTGRVCPSLLHYAGQKCCIALLLLILPAESENAGCVEGVVVSAVAD